MTSAAAATRGMCNGYYLERKEPCGGVAPSCFSERLGRRDWKSFCSKNCSANTHKKNKKPLAC